MDNKFIVYEILNTSTNKRYIGCSSDIKNRWNHHRHCLRLNKHGNSYLQRAWNKYGENIFIFTILYSFNSEELMFHKEKELIELDANNFYNLSAGGIGGSSGHKWSEKSRAKLSATKKLTAKKVMTQEVKDRISESRKGTKMHKNTKTALLKAKQKKCSVYSIEYDSIKEAAISNNITSSKMRRMILNPNIKECYLVSVSS